MAALWAHVVFQRTDELIDEDQIVSYKPCEMIISSKTWNEIHYSQVAENIESIPITPEDFVRKIPKIIYVSRYVGPNDDLEIGRKEFYLTEISNDLLDFQSRWTINFMI